MQPFPIPVRAIGPGSQPAEDAELDIMPLPRSIATFEMPRVPERVGAAVMLEARAWLERFHEALGRWLADAQPQGPVQDLGDLSAAALAVVNEVLGDGEVSIRVAGRPALQIQESVFGGLWRCADTDAEGRLLRHWLEAGAMPCGVATAAAAEPAPLRDPEPWPEGAMNSPALLAELRGRLAGLAADGRGGQINLTLLPLSEADQRVLEAALPMGAVAMISRGFGNCHVSSTAVCGVWRVQYFNSMRTKILDTIEVATMPEVALASPEDLADSRTRLAELIDWMAEAAER